MFDPTLQPRQRTGGSTIDATDAGVVPFRRHEENRRVTAEEQQEIDHHLHPPKQGHNNVVAVVVVVVAIDIGRGGSGSGGGGGILCYQQNIRAGFLQICAWRRVNVSLC